jgi:phytoene/squalene synthetase
MAATAACAHQVEHEHRDHAEEQQRDRVFGPAHLVRLVDARRAVHEALDRPQHRIEPRPLAREDLAHEAAERRRHEKDGEQEEQDLKPSVDRHVRTSPA